MAAQAREMPMPVLCKLSIFRLGQRAGGRGGLIAGSCDGSSCSTIRASVGSRAHSASGAVDSSNGRTGIRSSRDAMRVGSNG